MRKRWCGLRIQVSLTQNLRTRTRKDGHMFLVGSRDSSNNLYRITAVVIFIYFLGHTLGAILHTPYFSAQAHDVRSAMETVVFPCGGSRCTWFGFYMGFGLTVSIFLLFAAFATWYIGGLRRDTRVALRPITIGLAASFAVLGVLCVLYFFVQPLMFSIVVAGLLAVIAVRFP